MQTYTVSALLRNRNSVEQLIPIVLGHELDAMREAVVSKRPLPYSLALELVDFRVKDQLLTEVFGDVAEVVQIREKFS